MTRFSRYTSEFRTNITLAYPVVLGMLGHTLIGIVDKLMVGKLGPANLAAVSLGNSFIFIAMSLGIGFSTAITPIVAEADAEKNPGKVRSAFHHGVVLCSLLGISLFIVVWLARPLMQFMGQPQEVIALAMPYLGWAAFSLVPLIVYQGYKQFADGLSLTKYSMYAIVMSNIIHIPLNYMLIYGIWIFPKLGIVGAGVGTVISRIAMVIFMHFILANRSSLKVYFYGFSFAALNRIMIRRIASLGWPSAMQMLFETTLFTSAVWLCGSIGTTSQAANEIALSLATLTFMFALGLSVAATIRVSNQKGLGDYRYLLTLARSIFMLAILMETVFALFFIIFHKTLPHFFLDMDNVMQHADNIEVVAVAGKLLVIAAFFQLFDGIQVVVLGALRGLQDVKIPMYITFIAYWIIGFPVSFFLGRYTGMGAIGVWIGLLAGLAAAAVFLYIRFNRLTARLVSENHTS